MTATYQDFCENITKQLFDLIEKNGSLLTWQKRWSHEGCSLLPQGTNGLYHGANIIKLFMLQEQDGFISNQWFTFNQVKKLGGSVKKGAKSQEVFFWKLITTKDETESTEGSDNQEKFGKAVPIFKVYRVFNLEQTTLEPTHYPTPEFSENGINSLLGKLGASVSHFGNKAYYNDATDAIVLPQPDRFSSKENYYATLLHELTHWTGGKKDRLPRQCFDDYGTDIKARAEEELIAEIGSVLLAAHLGLRGELENHASYVQSWKQHLNEKEVMRAANKAAKAFEWIVTAGE